MNRRPQTMVIDEDQRMLRLLEITFEREGYDAWTRWPSGSRSYTAAL